MVQLPAALRAMLDRLEGELRRNAVAWRAEYDEWGNLSGEESPGHLEQTIRLPGKQYEEESGLYYNRHRYYNPGQEGISRRLR